MLSIILDFVALFSTFNTSVKEALKLEGYARNFQIDKEIAKREKQRLEISKISYRFGEGDSEKYLAKLSAYDKQKATTWRSWSRLRSQLTIVKILVLGNQDD